MFKHFLALGFVVLSLSGQGLHAYMNSINITEPRIIHSTTCEAGVMGYYSTSPNTITMCVPVNSPEYTTVYRHEYQHFLQDKQDGLWNTTVSTVTDTNTLERVWNALARDGHPLYQHIVAHYPSDRYLVELEAYILQNAPITADSITIGD